MKTQINSNIRTSLALALTIVIWSPLQAQAAETIEKKTTDEVKTMEHCHSMKEQKQKMLEALKAQDAVLTEKISQMNKASDDKKMMLMAEAVTLLAEQRMAMNVQKSKMEEMMQSMPMDKLSESHSQMTKDNKAVDIKK